MIRVARVSATHRVPEEWIKGEGLKKVCDWARHGLSDAQLANNMGICTTTFYKWLRLYPEFTAAIKDARIQPNIEIENSMFELACGRVFVDEIRTLIDPDTGKVTRIEKVRKQIPPNATMLIFLAKCRMRDKYQDFSPVPYEPDNAVTKQDVQIYLPENGRDKK